MIALCEEDQNMKRNCSALAKLIVKISIATLLISVHSFALEANDNISLDLFQPFVDLETNIKVSYRLESDLPSKIRSTQWPLVDNTGIEQAAGKISRRAGNGRFAVPIKTLKPGQYTIQLDIAFRDGSLATGKAAFTKMAKPEHSTRVAYDDAGVMRIDDEPNRLQNERLYAA